MLIFRAGRGYKVDHKPEQMQQKRIKKRSKVIAPGKKETEAIRLLIRLGNKQAVYHWFSLAIEYIHTFILSSLTTSNFRIH